MIFRRRVVEQTTWAGSMQNTIRMLLSPIMWRTFHVCSASSNLLNGRPGSDRWRTSEDWIGRYMRNGRYATAATHVLAVDAFGYGYLSTDLAVVFRVRQPNARDIRHLMLVALHCQVTEP